MQISSGGQELYEDDVLPPHIGLWEEHKLDKSFPSVCHVEVLLHQSQWQN